MPRLKSRLLSNESFENAVLENDNFDKVSCLAVIY